MASTVDIRLRDLGIELPAAPAAAGSYAQVIVSDDVAYTAGQIAVDGDAGLLATGKLGREVAVEQGIACARQCALNALAQLRSTLKDLDSVRQVLKVNVFIASAPEFIEQPAVANGASDVINAVLGEAGRHSRTAVGVAVLPLDSPVEVEMIVRFDKRT